MRIVFIFFILQNTASFGQGFYDIDAIFLSKANISKLHIKTVNALDLKADSTIHPLNNFVFEFKFDSTGEIEYKKYWITSVDTSNNDYLNVELVQSNPFMKSKIVGFNQFYDRTKKNIRHILKQFKLEESIYFTFSCCTEVFILDTVLLNKNVSIPNWLMPLGDSVFTDNDTIKVFTKTDSSNFLSDKYYKIGNNKLQIDRILDGKNEVWRSYTINEDGLIEKEMQGIYTKKYYYNIDKLHIKTESFINNANPSETVFRYSIKN